MIKNKNTIKPLISYIILIFFLFSFFFFLFFLTCSSPNGNDDLVTFSGQVTLEGETDHSGATVSLYKPVELDTALVRINQQYPNIGVQISQETEFDHREHDPVYTTTTKSDGSWEIKDVEKGKYNVVAEKEGWGWRVNYYWTNSEILINLKKVIPLSGFYSSNLNIPVYSFVEIKDNVVIENNSILEIGGGSIIIFYDNSSLKVAGSIFCLGEKTNRVYFIFSEIYNSPRIEIENCRNSKIEYIVCKGLNREIKINGCENLRLINSFFTGNFSSLEILSSNDVLIEGNVILNNETAIRCNSSKVKLYRNVVSECTDNGIEIINCSNIDLENNVLKNIYNYAININPSIGTAYLNTSVNIIKNDFLKNSNHIYVGKHVFIKTNENNFQIPTRYYVDTNSQNSADTLNFKYNYWDTQNLNIVNDKIIDKNDRLNLTIKGPIVDYSHYRTTPILWIEEI